MLFNAFSNNQWKFSRFHLISCKLQKLLKDKIKENRDRLLILRNSK